MPYLDHGIHRPRCKEKPGRKQLEPARVRRDRDDQAEGKRVPGAATEGEVDRGGKQRQGGRSQRPDEEPAAASREAEGQQKPDGVRRSPVRSSR